MKVVVHDINANDHLVGYILSCKDVILRTDYNEISVTQHGETADYLMMSDEQLEALYQILKVYRRGKPYPWLAK